MQKFKSVGLVGLGLILGVMGFWVISNNKSNETYENITTKENKELLSMMLETEAGSGKYQETTASSWPTDGYIFNETLSKCENGGTLSWDSNNKKVVMEGNSSDKCYVYFDVHITTIADYCSKGDNLSSCIKTFGNQGSEVSNIYIHNSNLTNGANDGSYRYAGSSETTNNFVCFAYDSSDETCPTDYLYRIIGVFDNKVKLIKYDYPNSNLLGTDGMCNDDTNSSYWVLYKGKQTKISVCNYTRLFFNDGFLQKDLNTNLLNNIGSKWSNKIAIHTWKMLYDFIQTTPSGTYTNEIKSTSDDTTFDGKIGFMYASEYGFAAAPSSWTLILSEYNSVTSDNWMYMGLEEGIIGFPNDRFVFVNDDGGTLLTESMSRGYYVRPTFYLNYDVTYVSGEGTAEAPIIIN